MAQLWYCLFPGVVCNSGSLSQLHCEASFSAECWCRFFVWCCLAQTADAGMSLAHTVEPSVQMRQVLILTLQSDYTEPLLCPWRGHCLSYHCHFFFYLPLILPFQPVLLFHIIQVELWIVFFTLFPSLCFVSGFKYIGHSLITQVMTQAFFGRLDQFRVE